MIKINIAKENDIINNISIKGHAKYDEYGKDIVCASVSSIVTTTINALIRLDKKSIEYNESDGLINIKIFKHNETIDTLLDNMIDILKELEKQYQNNIRIDN